MDGFLTELAGKVLPVKMQSIAYSGSVLRQQHLTRTFASLVLNAALARPFSLGSPLQSELSMSTSKHRKTRSDEAPRDDLQDNPGIGESKGTPYAGKADPELIQGGSTFEGDEENDTTAQGGVDPRHLGRTNK